MTTFFKYVQVQNFALAGSGGILGATTITLKSFKTIDGVVLSMTDFGLIGFGTLEPGNGAQEEQISFSGVTQNANGTATLTGVESVLFVNPYTGTSGLTKTHAGSTTFVISNTAGYYNQFGAKANDEILSGYWEAPDPITPQGLVTRDYMLALINGGSVSTNALVETGTAGETVSAGQVVYFKVADARWWKADASTANTVNDIQLGIAQGAGIAGGAIAGGVLRRGLDSNQSGGAAGAVGYVRNGGGLVNTVTGTVERVVGNYVSATTFLFNPDYYYMPTALQKGAFAGTSGIPSSSNPYATKATTDLLALITDVQVFTANGTWNKPTGARAVQVIVIGGGGSGASGDVRAFTTNNDVTPGGAGGGGAIAKSFYSADDLASSYSITVGSAVAGGIGVVNSGTTLIAGNSGTDGNPSSFGTLLVANGGKKGIHTTGGGGNGGFAVGFGSSVTPTSATAINGQGGTGGSSANGTPSEMGGGGGGDGSTSAGGSDVGFNGGGSVFGCGGGGGGSAATTNGNPAGVGGDGGGVGTYGNGGGGQGGQTAGANGSNGTRPTVTGTGGGGAQGYSDAPTSTVGGAGGTGGTPGGGGGGGGAVGGATGRTLTSGAGGGGARGEVIVITYF